MYGCYIKLVISEKSNLFRQHLRDWKLNIKYESYKHRLTFFNLDNLKSRRIKYNLILLFKIIHNLIDLQFDDFLSISTSFKLYQLRRHRLQINKPIPPYTLISLSFFSYCTINTWSHLEFKVIHKLIDL